MCGRYAASADPDALVEEFEVVEPPAERLAPSWNVAPTARVYVVRERLPEPAERHRLLSVARWGLVPSWATDARGGARMINARWETAATKPAFRRAFARRRCLLPADGYYEWYAPTQPDAPRGRGGKPLKQPYFIHPAAGGVLAMAGLYEWWRDRSRPDDDPAAWLLSTTILTTSATDDLGRIHDRMPLLVPRGSWDRWLDPGFDPGGTQGHAVSELVIPAAPGLLVADPVSTAVNNVRVDGPDLVVPLPAEPETGP